MLQRSAPALLLATLPRWRHRTAIHALTLALGVAFAVSGLAASSVAVAQGIAARAAYLVGPVVSPSSTIYQGEEHIAVDPNNPNFLVAVVTDGSTFLGDGRRRGITKYAVSLDNGATWRDSFVPLNPEGRPVASDRFVWDLIGDPVVAIDKSGYVFISGLYYTDGAASGGVYVNVSTVSDLTKFARGHGSGFDAAHTYVVSVQYDPVTTLNDDKEWIAVDSSANPATSGNVYVAWSRFFPVGGGFDEEVVLSRSTNHGRTWSTPIRLNKNDGSTGHGAQLAVGPAGELYVLWTRHWDGGSSETDMAKSTDGGLTFTRQVAITGPFKPLDGFNSRDTTYRKFSFASLAVSPVDGSLYVTYPDQNNKDGAEVQFIRSKDGGATFTAPVVVNDVSAGLQFMPAIAVDEFGTIHLSWFDTRNSPQNSSNLDIYATFSTDGGATFRPNARVTPNSFNVGIATFIGDYGGIAAGGGFAHPVWSTIYRTAADERGGSLKTAKLTVR